jgi:sulfur carrier protein ThiS
MTGDGRRILRPGPHMSAKIRPIGTLKTYTAGQAEVTVEAGHTVRETLAALGIPSEVVAGVLLNDGLQSKDYRVQEGDILKLIAVIGGGER